MEFSKRSLNIIKIFFLLLIYINIIVAGKENILLLIMLFSLSLGNDLFRKKVLKASSPEKRWSGSSIASMLFTIGTAVILEYMIGSYIYIYITLIDLLFFDKKQLPVPFLGFYAICYLIPDTIYFIKGGNTAVAWSNLGYSMLYFLGGVLICILVLEQIKQKEKLALLNQQLNEKNEMLRQQQQVNEELARSKEREMIAQELHDSIGHTLVAVKMYVKVLERYVAVDTDKEKEILSLLNEVIQNSIVQLRKTVYRLKENNQYSNLKESIERLIQSSRNTQGQEIYLVYDDELEEIELGLKEDIYKSIRECITNAMKYAEAEHIWIALSVTDTGIEFSVADDGVGVDVIRKSYGILGIEDRMKKWNGICRFNSTKNKGFSLQVQINYKQQGGNKG